MNPDDYDIFNPQIGGRYSMPDHIPTEEEKLYHELIGKYQGIINATGQTTENVIWESVNTVLQILIEKGHNHYSRFIIKPTQLGPRDFINYESFKAQLMSALQRMSQDFNFSDPSYLIYEHLPKSGSHINNNAISSPSQYNNQSNNQTQSQTQEIELTMDQRLSLLEHALEENLTEQQLKEIKPAFEEYKAEPTKWSKASKLIQAVLGLSKDVAVGVISNIISTQMGIPKL